MWGFRGGCNFETPDSGMDGALMVEDLIDKNIYFWLYGENVDFMKGELETNLSALINMYGYLDDLKPRFGLPRDYYCALFEALLEHSWALVKILRETEVNPNYIGEHVSVLRKLEFYQNIHNAFGYKGENYIG